MILTDMLPIPIMCRSWSEEPTNEKNVSAVKAQEKPHAGFFEEKKHEVRKRNSTKKARERPETAYRINVRSILWEIQKIAKELAIPQRLRARSKEKAGFLLFAVVESLGGSANPSWIKRRTQSCECSVSQ